LPTLEGGGDRDGGERRRHHRQGNDARREHIDPASGAEVDHRSRLGTT
jgi:hypothetical protein